jgi:TPR repeat protein
MLIFRSCILLLAAMCVSCVQSNFHKAGLAMIEKDREDRLRHEVEECLQPAEQGDMKAQYQCSLALAGLGGADNLKKGVAFLQSSAEVGYAPAQHTLGAQYARGEVVAQDYATAILWYQRAGEQGYGPSQRILATMYYTGQGTEINYAAAAKWCRLAAAQGDYACMASLAELHEAGLGVSRDPNEAIRLYNEAERGASKNYQIARMYAEGMEGKEPDAVNAARWICGRAAVVPGEAEFVLGEAYESGKAKCGKDTLMPMDNWLRSLGRARIWYVQAVEKGHARAKERLDRMTGKLMSGGRLQGELPELEYSHFDSQSFGKNKFVMLMTPPATKTDGLPKRRGITGECGNEERLSETRVSDLKSIRERFESNGYLIDKVLTAPDCASIETARAVFGQFEVHMPLKNTSDLPIPREAANAAFFKLVSGFSGPKNLVVVADRLSIFRLTNTKLLDSEVLLVTSRSDSLNRGTPPGIRVVGVLSATQDRSARAGAVPE